MDFVVQEGHGMTKAADLDLRVGVDVGAGRHSVAVGLSDGRLLDEFEI